MPMHSARFLSFSRTASSLRLSVAVASAKDHGIARRANAILLAGRRQNCQEISDFLYLGRDRYHSGLGIKNLFCKMVGCPCFRRLKGSSRMTRAPGVALCRWLEAALSVARLDRDQRPMSAAECGLNYFPFLGCPSNFWARLGFEYRKASPCQRALAQRKNRPLSSHFYERLMREFASR